MALYPAQLTPEEKALKKKYAKLLEKVARNLWTLLLLLLLLLTEEAASQGQREDIAAICPQTNPQGYVDTLKAQGNLA